MSARGFGSVIWAGAVAGAALGFYLVSLRVASERAALEEVETEIALAQRDIRLLQTEIGTRGRLAQLERWNVKFIRLSAPNAEQFVEGGFQLASLVAPQKTPVIDAPVVLASAPVEPPPLTREPVASEPRASRPASEMMHVASYAIPQRAPAQAPAVARPALPKPEASLGKPPAEAASATKTVKTATADPLAPLPGAKSKAKGTAPAATVAGSSPQREPKDSVTD